MISRENRRGTEKDVSFVRGHPCPAPSPEQGGLRSTLSRPWPCFSLMQGFAWRGGKPKEKALSLFFIFFFFFIPMSEDIISPIRYRENNNKIVSESWRKRGELICDPAWLHWTSRRPRSPRVPSDRATTLQSYRSPRRRLEPLALLSSVRRGHRHARISAHPRRQ